MAQSVTLPFTITRSSDVVGATAITQTKETVHGLLRILDDEITIEWRTFRQTDFVGSEIRTNREVDPVRTVTVPLQRIGGAAVRRAALPWPFKPRMVLTAGDLQAFEEIAGEQGLRLAHPAELVLTLRRADRLRADEFVAELALALAQLGAGADRNRLEEGDTRTLPRDSSE